MMQAEPKKKLGGAPPDDSNNDVIDQRDGEHTAALFGTPAPPLDDADLNDLYDPHGGGRKKKAPPRRRWFGTIVMLFVALLLVGIGAVMAIAAQVTVSTRGYDIALTAATGMGERYEAPPVLPSDLVFQGRLTPNFQRGELQQLDWHVWYLSGRAGETYQFSVFSLADQELLPIVGVYDALTRVRLTAPDVAVRSAEDKTVLFKIPADGEYVLLVGSIGGVAGKYEVRAEQQPQ